MRVGPALRTRLPIDDLVQEVWARAWAAFPSFDYDRARFRSWLFGIANNVLLEQLRHLHSRRPKHDSAALQGASEPKDPATSIASSLAATDERAAIAAAIDSLTEDERRVVLWRGFEKQPYAEIGKRLGLSTVAVESWWRRLVKRLHERLCYEFGEPR